MPIIAHSPSHNARVPFQNQHQPLPAIEYQCFCWHFIVFDSTQLFQLCHFHLEQTSYETNTTVYTREIAIAFLKF